MGFQSSIYQWCWDHRTHHKYSDTDADPHNAKRGFFYSHIGWFMCRRHPLSLEKGRTIDMSDLKANPIIIFQHKYYWPLAIVIWAVIPTLIPCYFWNEDPITSFTICVAFRTVYVSNYIFLVNSAAHMWGYKVIMVIIGLYCFN
jgi:stearoyl-CoA desaturase (delta-9 desaturase)